MLQEFTKYLHPYVVNRIWIISDLQQSLPENAEYCMACAIADFKQLSLDCQRIVYLGDAVEGHNLELINTMTQMQIRELGSLGIMTCYVTGNHDFDYFRHFKDSLNNAVLPFYETIKAKPLWNTSDHLEDYYFIEEFDDFAFVYLTDHSAPDGSWFTSHGIIHGDVDKYPYDMMAYHLLNEKIAQLQKPVFTFSHYAFSGGNRPSSLMDRLLPLPGNVKIHFYGHAHIGDREWAGKDCFRKISSVDNQNIPQIDVASLENFRGNAVRSVFFEIYRDGGYGILFRNHTLQKWDEMYFISK